MKRYLKITVVGLAAVVALALTVSKRGPAMMVGLGRTTGAANVERKPYDLNNSLNTFNQTLLRIHDSYVDPTRVEPKQMLLAALDSLQKQVAEVMVEPFPEQNRVVVHVDTAVREFRIDNVDAVPAAARGARGASSRARPRSSSAAARPARSCAAARSAGSRSATRST